MEEDQLLASQLGGFALDAFLSEFTGDSSIRASGLQALNSGGAAARAGGSGVEASQIYGDKFADDDDDDDLEGDEDDIERQVDAELNAEDAAIPAIPAMPMPMPLLHSKDKKMRGEEDNFDDDDDEDDDDTSRQFAAENMLSNGLFLPQAAGPSSSSSLSFPPLPAPIQVKQEDTFDDAAMQINAFAGGDDIDAADAAELAAQQALFQQSYARMQANSQQMQQQQQQMQQQQDGMFPVFVRQPSPPVMDTATLYPGFAPDKVLNFTELFVPRPRKRARIDPTTELRKLMTSTTPFFH